MTLKRFILLHIQLYFVLVTLIFAASMVIGLIVAPEQEIYYYQLSEPFIMAALCVMPFCITYFKEEPTIKQYIIRHIIQLALIEVIVLSMITPPDNTDKALFYIVLGAVVFAIYVLSKMIVWFQKYRQSQKMTEQLKRLQENEI